MRQDLPPWGHKITEVVFLAFISFIPLLLLLELLSVEKPISFVPWPLHMNKTGVIKS